MLKRKVPSLLWIKVWSFLYLLKYLVSPNCSWESHIWNTILIWNTSVLENKITLESLAKSCWCTVMFAQFRFVIFWLWLTGSFLIKKKFNRECRGSENFYFFFPNKAFNNIKMVFFSLKWHIIPRTISIY